MVLENKRTKNCHCVKTTANWTEQGFSLVELIIVIAIVGIMATFAIFQLVGHKAAYGTEDQALKIIDLMREARQRAITQRQVMRFEIDFDSNIVRVIDEQTVQANTADDIIVRQDLLSESVALMRDPNPSGPPDGIDHAASREFFKVPFATTTDSTHPLSRGHKVCAVRFRSNGTAVGPEEGNGISSGTLFIWTPQAGNRNTPQSLQLVHAITLQGESGNVRLWQYNGANFVGK